MERLLEGRNQALETTSKIDEVTWMQNFFWSKEGQELLNIGLILYDLEVGKEKFPNNACGQCSFYKTPKCTYEYYVAYITKKDSCCADFFPDRHIPRNKLKKPRVVQKRVE